MSRLYSLLALPLMSFLLAVVAVGIGMRQDCTRDTVSALFLTDPTQALIRYADGTVEIWDVEQGRFLRTLTTLPGVGMALHPQRQVVALADAQDALAIWDMARGESIETIVDLRGTPDEMLFSPNGDVLFTGIHMIRWLDLYWYPIARDAVGSEGRVYDVAVAPDGSAWFTIDSQDRVAVLNPMADRVLQTLSQDAPIRALAISPAGDFLATGSTDGVVQLWNVEGWTPRIRWQGAEAIRFLHFLPADPAHLVIGEANRITLWAWSNDGAVQQFAAEGIQEGVLAPNGRVLLTVGKDAAQVWDLQTGQRLSVLCTNLLTPTWLAALTGVVIGSAGWRLDAKRKRKENVADTVVQGLQISLIAAVLVFLLGSGAYLLRPPEQFGVSLLAVFLSGNLVWGCWGALMLYRANLRLQRLGGRAISLVVFGVLLALPVSGCIVVWLVYLILR